MKIQVVATVLALVLCAAVPAQSIEDVAVDKFLLKGAATAKLAAHIALQKGGDDDKEDDTKDDSKDDEKDDKKDDKKDSSKGGDDDDDDKKDKKKRSSKGDDDDDDDKKNEKKRRNRSLNCSGRNEDGFCTKSKNEDKKYCVEWEEKCEDEGKKLKKEDEDLCLELGFCLGDDSAAAKTLLLKGSATKNSAVKVALDKGKDDDDDDDDDDDSKSKGDDDDDDDDSKSKGDDDDDDDSKSKGNTRRGYRRSRTATIY
mmetsp:Transcript_6252/g.13713  ORF Transcript_6252/g.13713 Transcript_6252/m.13713 type:complete len:256 (+) Transcript_6252:92-859(+)